MEWLSLALFTVMVQTAVGLVTIYGLLSLTGSAREKAADYGRLGSTIFLTAGITTAIAALISLTHLGWPLFAARVLMGLGSSPLSWEVLLTGLFAAGAFGLWWLSRSGTVAPWLTALCALLGIGSVYFSGMIYTMPSVPANDNAFPVILFLVTALVTGGAALLLLLALTESGKALAPEWISTLSLLTLSGVVLAIVTTLTYTTAAAAGAREAQEQAALITGNGLHLARMTAGLLLPGALLAWLARRPARATAALLLVATVVVAGELAGRWLFFEAMTFTGIGTGL